MKRFESPDAPASTPKPKRARTTQNTEYHEGTQSSQVNVASDIKMVPKALKACRACRRSKIKCHGGGGTENGKCKKCLEQKLECVFEIKVPTPSVATTTTTTTTTNTTAAATNTVPVATGPVPVASESSNSPVTNVDDVQWKNSVESRLDKFGSTLDTILGLLEQRTNSSPPVAAVPEPEPAPENNVMSFGEFNMPSFEKMEDQFGYNTLPLDDLHELFTNEDQITTSDPAVISYDQAERLFDFFHEKISPHLFGYSISQVSLSVVWYRSPILVAAICTVASIHHPDLNTLFPTLKAELERLAQKTMFNTMHTETEAIDTIIALCVAGFWLPNCSMLTSIAHRLAQNLGLALPQSPGNQDKDKLRLWYLLYILDGNQSLVYNQTPTIGHDQSVSQSRTLLLDDQQQWQSVNPFSRSDMRLVSQVEFNHAVKSIFEGRGWDLLKPSALGIPWQTNIELDKWMVSWACLLTPDAGNMGPWPSKSTLIHYNFAKMHINSQAIREIQASQTNLEEMSYVTLTTNSGDDATDTMAVSAARNVLKLSTTDKDICDALRYVPIHIHMMLYYAALLLLHSANSDGKIVLLVKRLQQLMVDCSDSRNQSVMTTISKDLKKALASKTSHLAMSYDISEEDGYDKKIAAWPGSILRPER